MIRPLALALLCAAPAVAEPWDCAFTVECEAGAGCEPIAVSLRVIAADHAGDLFLSSSIGDSPVLRLTPPGTLPATYAGSGRDGIAELLTIEADRTALLTLHIFDGAAAAATHFGTCEGLQ
ncbi:hypothetical protein [Roseicyclus persicicus]|uniref:Excinuclease ABC subunit B n=1 Tax=Roseicyclus persicicus TaxID=2650661 RepID=A0A7X6H115_9RHOB|nr:hypothetical protein [Roseibacterium persicicum]NKX46067.1 hypothetical protein [Roseibacterium persicicum]